MFIVLLGSGATFFYNLISNFLRAMGDSKTPLYYLVFSSLLNAVLCMWTGWHKFDEFHLRREDFSDLMRTSASHLKIGFTMGFQMSVMCIGQLSMQSAVNALGSVAVAGYLGVCLASPLAWLGACSLLVPVYYHMIVSY